MPTSREAAKIAARSRRTRELEFVSVGRHGETLKLVSVTRMHDGSRLLVEVCGEKRYVALPLVGQFQISNALVAAGLAIATGIDALKALDALAYLKGASGRLELVGSHPNGAQDLRRLRAHARRARQCAEGASSAHEEQARSSSSAQAAIAIPASAH